MTDSVTISRDEYDMLLKKASLFENFVETEELSDEELARVKKSLEGPFMDKSEFLKRHPELSG